MSSVGDEILRLRRELRENGIATRFGLDGKLMVFMLSSRIPGQDEPKIFVAWEGQGAAYLRLDRPFNIFQLVSAGFQLASARVLTDLVNELLGYTGTSIEARGIEKREGIDDGTQSDPKSSPTAACSAACDTIDGPE